jgi:hypothetical protein
MSFAFSKLLDTLEVIKKQKRKTGNARGLNIENREYAEPTIIF